MRRLSRWRWAIWVALLVVPLVVPLLSVEIRGAYVRLVERLGWPLIVRLTQNDLFEHAPDLPIGRDRMQGMIRLASLEQMQQKRRDLIQFIWKAPERPVDQRPPRVDTGIDDQAFASAPNLSHIDRITIELPLGFRSYVYYFHPKRSRDRLAIYHQGHEGSFRLLGRSVIDALLEDGLTVLALDMPMRGLNAPPAWVEVPGIGPISFRSGSHWTLAVLESADFSPLRLFLDPVLRSLDYALAHEAYDDVIMVGLSGGGWTTTLVAAIDPRVKRSYPVAGSAPFFLRLAHPRTGEGGSDGDYEQRVAGLYQIANYLELYVLGSVGEGRRQVQILNKYDPCCFLGGWARVYAPVVTAAVARLGTGDYRLFVDDSQHEHAISAAAIALVLGDGWTD